MESLELIFIIIVFLIIFPNRLSLFVPQIQKHVYTITYICVDFDKNQIGKSTREYTPWRIFVFLSDFQATSSQPLLRQLSCMHQSLGSSWEIAVMACLIQWNVREIIKLGIIY